ncbi:MAG: DUF169 domain-containing protein [Thermodesulfobacteriota bacterium]|nr:DUF169 domain-containing protein [Thermodesulfobacteriota bacterium]
MEELKLLEERIGGRWTGITFNGDDPVKEEVAPRKMRLCEAIKESYTRPLVLTKDLISCPGALRSLGWATDLDESIARQIAKVSDTDPGIAQKLVTHTPQLEHGVSVTIGNTHSPDIAISYAQPEAAMRLLRLWQQANGTDLDIAASSVMAVCGSVVAKVHRTHRICLSFGCPDSRKYGAIGRDRLVIGLPTDMVRDFL